MVAENDAAAIPHLMVGFNRRFSHPFVKMKEVMEGRREPLAIIYRVNAGFVAKDHWSQDAAQGGRIIGEACHFVDTMRFLAGSRVVSVQANSIRSENERVENRDTSSITITMDDFVLESERG